MWKEKHFIDLWSIVHFIFGVLFVFFADFFDLTFSTALVTLTILIIIWEMIEYFSGKAVEYFSNRVTDVIFADVGFLFMYFLLLINSVPKEVYIAIFSLMAIIFVSLNINGWSNHLKKLEKQNKF